MLFGIIVQRSRQVLSSLLQRAVGVVTARRFGGTVGSPRVFHAEAEVLHVGSLVAANCVYTMLVSHTSATCIELQPKFSAVQMLQFCRQFEWCIPCISLNSFSRQCSILQSSVCTFAFKMLF